jgi:hypothetical protein
VLRFEVNSLPLTPAVKTVYVLWSGLVVCIYGG